MTGRYDLNLVIAAYIKILKIESKKKINLANNYIIKKKVIFIQTGI